MTAEDGRSVTLTIPSKPEYIVLARLALAAVMRLTPLGPTALADLKLAITEAATSSMGSDPEELLELVYCLEDERLVLEVRGSRAPSMPYEEQALAHAIIEATVDEFEHRGASRRLIKYLHRADD